MNKNIKSNTFVPEQKTLFQVVREKNSLETFKLLHRETVSLLD